MHRFFITPFLLLIAFLSIPSSLSAPFSTLAISHVSNGTIICTLVPLSSSSKKSDLICTTLPHRITESFSSSTTYTGSTFTQYSAVATGEEFLCGITSTPGGNGSMRWWSFSDEPNPLDGQIVYSGPLRAVSAGDYHVCGLTGVSRKTECWEWSDMAIPEEVNFTSISVGMDFLCGITIHNEIKCFGEDDGIVGNEPVGNFTILATGSTHACAVTTGGNLTCWGVGAPKLDNIPSDLMLMTLGTNLTCILTSNGTAQCWGEDAKLPYWAVETEFVSIEAKGDSVCGVLMSNFSVICWGNKNFGSNNLVYNRSVPGICVPEESCGCGIVGDSANMCSVENYVICKSCKISLIASSHVNITPLPDTPSPNGKKRIVYMVVGIAGTAFLISMLILIFGLYKIKQRRDEKKKFNPSSIIDPGRMNDIKPVTIITKAGLGCTEFSLRTLNRATDYFAEGNSIGSGGYGTVYWGVLPDGRQVAVKRAHRRRRRHAETAFLSELALLSRVNHKNLVRLIGFCEERGERLLVVEYMENGTLHKYLHGTPSSDSSPLFALWSTRISIALDAARGIEYLHSYAVPGIIHRDIKPSNILLDNNWMAKVSDFGLSMTRTGAEATAAGTIGYMDPEYYRIQELTVKSDVYSFGVVLLEIITGMRAVVRTEDNDEEPCHIAEYVVPIVEAGETRRLIDNKVPIRDLREEKALERILKLAVQCVRARGSARPAMREIVMELEWALSLCEEEDQDDEEMVDVVVEVDGSNSSASPYELEWGFPSQSEQLRNSLRLDSNL